MAENSNRWWENYLVRYFLPSVAGMIIVSWLNQNTGDGIIKYVPTFMPADLKDFGTAHLILWLLFGNLYCYIASYPILTFHATRVLDFKDVTGNATRLWCNPYISSLIFALLAYVAAWNNCISMALVLVLLFSSLQIYRLYKSCFIQKEYGLKKLGAKTSIIYAYLNKLSKRRGVVEQTASIKTEADIEEDESTLSLKTNPDKDLSDSYRHLREHGNTAFIFLLELALCPIFFTALKHDKNFLFLPVILIVWVTPSVFVHWLGQHLERRYSLFKH